MLEVNDQIGAVGVDEDLGLSLGVVFHKGSFPNTRWPNNQHTILMIVCCIFEWFVKLFFNGLDLNLGNLIITIEQNLFYLFEQSLLSEHLGMGFLAVFVEVRDETLDSLLHLCAGLLLLDVHFFVWQIWFVISKIGLWLILEIGWYFKLKTDRNNTSQ